MLGGYHPERLALADALLPLRDVDAMIEWLIVIRETVGAAPVPEG